MKFASPNRSPPVAALLLDPDNRLAYGNLLAAVNNWALALGDCGNFADAESLLNEGRQFDPTHLPFVHNAEHLQQMQLQAEVASVKMRTFDFGQCLELDWFLLVFLCLCSPRGEQKIRHFTRPLLRPRFLSLHAIDPCPGSCAFPNGCRRCAVAERPPASPHSSRRGSCPPRVCDGESHA